MGNSPTVVTTRQSQLSVISISANRTRAESSMTGIGLRREVLALYRDVLRVARGFPERSIGRKLHHNARELLRLRQHERNAARIHTHLAEGRDALDVYRVLQSDPELLTVITRKKKPANGTN